MKHAIAILFLINLFCFSEESAIQITPESKVIVYSNYF